MKGFGLTRNFWVALVTVIIIGLLFTYYLMVYVKGRERIIYDKKFRELDRIGQNILVLKQEHGKRLEGFLTDTVRQWLGLMGAEEADYLHLANINWYTSQPPITPFELAYKIKGLGNAWAKINFADSLGKSLQAESSVGKLLVIRVLDPNQVKMQQGAVLNDADCEKKKIALLEKWLKLFFQNLPNEVRLQSIDSLILQRNGLNWSGVAEIKLGETEFKLFTHWLTLDQGDDLLLVVFERADTIKSEATAVEPWVIINILSLFLFLFLGMPLLKILVMNEVERLQTVNVLFTGIAIVLGTALIILFTNYTNHFYGYHYEEVDKKLRGVSDAIRNDFLKEVRQGITQMDSLENKSNYFPKPIYNSVLQDDYVSNCLHDYRPFNQIFWVSKDGRMPRVLATNSIDTLKQKLPIVSQRKYFKAVLNDNLWTNVKDDQKKVMKPLFIEFIRSMLDGQYQAVISTRLNENKIDPVVLALSTKMFSLQYSILPPGFHACIIDERGDVKFHSTASRSLQENFLDETDRNPELVAAVAGRVNSHTSITYNEKKFRSFVQPIDGTPLYLITFYSFEYYKAPMILTVWFTCGLLMLLFLLIAIQLVILFAVTFTPSKLKVRPFFLHWLRPKRLPDYREKYVQSIASCSLLLILFIGLFIFFP